MLIEFCVIGISIFRVAVVAGEQPLLNVKVWQSTGANPSAKDYPESELLSDKPNTAIGFSGGGSRAYTAAIGYLAALHELDLMKNVRFIGGISGGGWATTTYSYNQNISDDGIFLGSITHPEDINREELQQMDTQCARGFASSDVLASSFEALLDGEVSSVGESWNYGISKAYLEPVGILRETKFSWNEASIEDIKARNPQLANETFIFPIQADRPFPIIGAALVGPSEGAPFGEVSQNYTLTEFTPLYIGQMNTLDVSFSYANDPSDVHIRRIGGAIEPFAFGSGIMNGPDKLLKEGESTATLNVPAPTQPIDLARAAGAGSYATGAFFESIFIADIARSLDLEFDYWSPTSPSNTAEEPTTATAAAETASGSGETVGAAGDVTTMMYTDGGCYENTSLISYLQRGVKKIILFFSSSVPLQPFDSWDVYTDAYLETQITNDLSAYFGALGDEQEPRWENRSYEYEMNQVFATEDYGRVVTALQTAQQEGKGIIASFNLTTVENSWWGVPAGFECEITITYLGRLAQWEQLLSKEMQELVIPKENSEDLSNDVDHGPFRDFPHYATDAGMISYERANLLANMVGWSVLQFEDLFRHMLS